MTDNDWADPVGRFVSEYIDALEAGVPGPEPEGLTDDERREAEDLLAEMVLDFGAEVDVAIPPVEESTFAVEHGVVRRPPPAAIHGDALRRARIAAGLTIAQVAAQLGQLGITADAARIDEMEEVESTLLAARDARRYAAVVGVPLEQIEASAEPWPATDRADLDVGGTHPLIVMGSYLVFRLGDGFDAGVIRCRGLARDLDSLTFRKVAANLLHGDWDHLRAAVLVTARVPRKVLVVSPFDCNQRVGAPSGEVGFGALAPAEDLDVALSHYNERFAIAWSDPSTSFIPANGTNSVTALDNRHVQSAAALIRKSLNRFAEPKGIGCRLALDWFGRATPAEIDRLVEALPDGTDDEAVARLAQLVGAT